MIDCLVVGGDSPIGTALVAALRRANLDVAWTTRRRDGAAGVFLDLETQEGLDRLPPARRVALVAAETKFQTCEEDPERARRINVDAPLALAARAIERGQRVLFFSSIAVHDGMVDMPDEQIDPLPNNTYGRLKLETEQRLAALGGDVATLRLSKVIPPGFALWTVWLDALRARQPITPFSDIVLAPVSLELVVSVATRLLLEATGTGVFQVSAADQVTYADTAAWLAEYAQVDPQLVQPVSSLSRNPSMWRPAFARLGCRRASAELGFIPPPAKAAFEYFVRNLQ
jgi:dTDP-4-dehydrorhamnose reductase